MKSFFIFFYILDQIFEQCKENDLGGFLGAISPELCKDARPIDKAIVDDWMKYSDPETVNKENIINRTYDFLNYYEQRFGYVFSETNQCLMNIKDKKVVDRAYERSQLMYQKYIDASN